MIAFVGLVLALAVLAFIAHPLLRRREEAVPGDEPLGELLSRRDTTYAAIKELRHDYELGNLSPEDHGELEERYKRKAVSILKEIDAAGVEDEVEQEVSKLRRRPTAAADTEAREDEIESELACARCGAGCRRGDRFCSSCGASLQDEGTG